MMTGTEQQTGVCVQKQWVGEMLKGRQCKGAWCPGESQQGKRTRTTVKRLEVRAWGAFRNLQMQLCVTHTTCCQLLGGESHHTASTAPAARLLEF